MSKIVILDYGHGSLDEKGINHTPSRQIMVNGRMKYEGFFNRAIGSVIFHLLRWHQYDVVEIISRNDPSDMPLKTRAQFANTFKDAILLSIHCNASTSHSARGFEVFTTKGQTKADPLAQLIYEHVEPLSRDFGFPMRSDHSDGDQDKEANHYITWQVKHPAVLIEALFYDNVYDVKLLENEAFLQKFGVAVFNAVVEYLKSDEN